MSGETSMEKSTSDVNWALDMVMYCGCCSGCHGDGDDDVTGSEVRMLQYNARDDVHQ